MLEDVHKNEITKNDVENVKNNVVDLSKNVNLLQSKIRDMVGYLYLTPQIDNLKKCSCRNLIKTS